MPRFRFTIATCLGFLAAYALASAQDRARGQEDAFQTHVRPLLVKHCNGCHGGAKPKAGLDLMRFTKGSEFLKEIDLLELVGAQVREGQMPPPNKPKPTGTEVDALTAWVDATMREYERNTPVDPGRVTLRRLNRVEYNNTIRDLFGIDAKLADDFPADDVGYGFDNIGDVLSLSPLLLEKYLNAAEIITQRAIAVAPRSRQERFPAKVLGSTFENNLVRDKFRSLHSNGSVFVNAKVAAPGEYQISVRAFADQAGPEVAKMALHVGDREVRKFDVRAREEAPRVFSHRMRLRPGTHKIEAAFINDYYNPMAKDPRQRDRNLYIESITLEGPMSTDLLPQPDGQRRIVFIRPDEKTSVVKAARQVLERFATLAYRRPVTTGELDRLVRIVENTTKAGEPFERGIQIAVQAILISPHFLYRVELDAPGAGRGPVRQLNDYEIASRLSYFLWSTMPDEELFDLAKKGELQKPSVRSAQVRRMLADPKHEEFVRNFAGQWLQLRNLANVNPDQKLFPQFNDRLRADMRRESELFFGEMLRENRSLLDLIDADFTFVNERLARLYGLPGVRGEEFRRVSLAGTARGGILTQASVLTVTSNPTRTSPVKRGKWIMENLLNSPPPPPPPDVPELSDSSEVEAKGTLRQRMEQHRSNPSCASCHAKMDALGFAFENFDAIGGWRNKDGGTAIDPSGVLPNGRAFKDPIELKRILRERDEEFRRCLIEKVLTYAIGRGLERSDRPLIARLSKSVKDQDNRLVALIIEVVQSDAFLMRRSN
jgi:mono/diheme cytochrome c family protein